MTAARQPRFSLLQQTEGAMLAVVATIMSLATYLPLAGAFFMLAAPAAIALAAIRHGMRLCLTVALLGTVLLLILAGPYEAMFFVTTSAGFGVIIGALVRFKLRGGALFVAGILAVGVLQGFSIEVGGRLSGIGGFSSMKTQFQTGLVQVREWSAKTPGFSADPAVLALLDRAIEPLCSVPLVMMLVAGFSGFLIQYLFSRWALGRMGVALEPLPAFREWRLPPWVAYVLMAAFLFLASGTPPEPSAPWPPAASDQVLSSGPASPSTTSTTALVVAPPALFGAVTLVSTSASSATTTTTPGALVSAGPRSLREAFLVNVFLVMLYLFGILGLAAVSDWLHRLKVAAPLRILGYFYLIASPLAMFTVMLGLFDTLFALRDPELMQQQQQEREEKTGAGEGAAGAVATVAAGEGAGRDQAPGDKPAPAAPAEPAARDKGKGKKRSKR